MLNNFPEVIWLTSGSTGNSVRSADPRAFLLALAASNGNMIWWWKFSFGAPGSCQPLKLIARVRRLAWVSVGAGLVGAAVILFHVIDFWFSYPFGFLDEARFCQAVGGSQSG